jgi:hypothetical protein
MIAELTVIIVKLKTLRDQNERTGLYGVVGYLDGAIDSLQDCAKDYQKHSAAKRGREK